MKIDLPNTLRVYDKIVYDPFCIFEKKNFLEDKIYQELKANFPEENIFPGIHQNGNKIFLNNKHDEFHRFIERNIWGDFYNYFNKNFFLESLIKLIKPELEKIENRSNFKNYYFKKNWFSCKF